MPLRGFVRPCVSALGARDNALFRLATVMSNTSVASPLYLFVGQRPERPGRIRYLSFVFVSRLHNYRIWD
jgi:hypothetical protein